MIYEEIKKWQTIHLLLVTLYVMFFLLEWLFENEYMVWMQSCSEPTITVIHVHDHYTLFQFIYDLGFIRIKERQKWKKRNNIYEDIFPNHYIVKQLVFLYDKLIIFWQWTSIFYSYLPDCNNSATVVLHAELLLIDRCGLLAKLSSSSISELSKPDSVSFIWKGVQIWMESGIR